ncbi:hypothetical protein RHECNPAF_1330096 [Rhizobium etli CNPAF512]|nr:hypothetical protein RHECNPAF_1330096 [Rhizobium etli CNPAF512]
MFAGIQSVSGAQVLRARIDRHSNHEDYIRSHVCALRNLQFVVSNVRRVRVTLLRSAVIRRNQSSQARGKLDLIWRLQCHSACRCRRLMRRYFEIRSCPSHSATSLRRRKPSDTSQ